MGIVVNYQPRSDISGKLAALAGQGVFRQKRDVFARQSDEFNRNLAQQQLNADRANAYRYAQLAQQQRQNNQSTVDRQQGRMASLYSQQMQQAGAVDRQQTQNEAMLQRDQAQNEAVSQRDQTQNEAVSQRDTIRELDRTSNEMLSSVADKKMNAVGNEIASKMTRKWRSMQKDRGNMLPGAWSQAVGQFQDDLQQSGVLDDTYDAQEPTVDDILEKRLRTTPGGAEVLINPETGDVKELKGKSESTTLSPKEQSDATLKENELTRKQKIDDAKQEADRIAAVSKIAEGILSLDSVNGDGNMSPEDAVTQAAGRYASIKKALDKQDNDKKYKYGFPRPKPEELDSTIVDKKSFAEAIVGKLFMLKGVPHVKVSDTEAIPYSEFPRDE